MTEKDLRVIVAHPFLVLGREFQWDDRQLDAARKLIDLTVIRLAEEVASPLPERLRALATEAAREQHRGAAMITTLDDGQHVFADEEGDDTYGFSTCPHPDCQLVRAGEGAP